MGRPKVVHHVPGKRRRGRMWQIFWKGAGGVYGLSVGSVTEEEAESYRLEIELAIRTGRWPEWAADLPAVRRYVQEPGRGEDLLESYRASISGELSTTWAVTSLGALRELATVAGKDFSAVTARDAQGYLDHVLRTPGPWLRRRGARTRSTRNRMLAACSRFYRWAVRAGYVSANPFAGIPRLMEPEAGEIAYLTRAERDALLAAVESDRRGVAIWLACYAGLRRGEVYRCRWQDVSWSRGAITVPAGKTGRGRLVPLAAALAERLRAGRRRRGVIVPRRADVAWEREARVLLADIVDRKPRAGRHAVARELVRWNVFRHTFGSLLVQEGVSVDKVAAWLGNTAAICRRHYAQVVPRDRRDADVDRL